MPHIKLLQINEFLAARRIFEGADGPEGTLAWFQTLASATLKPNEECALVAAFDGDGLIRAALPLVRGPADSLRSLTSPYTTVYAPPLHDLVWSRYLGSQAKAFVRNVLRLDALDLACAGTAAFLEGLATSGLAVARFEHFQNWYDEINEFASYWSDRPGRLRSTVARKLLFIAKTHEAHFQCASGGKLLEQGVAAYEDVYKSSWKSAEPDPNFIKTLVTLLGASGSVRLGTMTLDGTVVAAQIWLVRGQKATIFKLAHRQEFSELSPGTLLTHWMLDKLCREERFREIDFGRGNDRYKRDWLGHSRPRYGAVAAKWTTGRGMLAAAREVYITRLSNWARSRRALAFPTNL
jgi:hypothetical protein